MSDNEGPEGVRVLDGGLRVEECGLEGESLGVGVAGDGVQVVHEAEKAEWVVVGVRVLSEREP